MDRKPSIRRAALTKAGKALVPLLINHRTLEGVANVGASLIRF